MDNINIVLWDNDGVLVDTERLYFEVTRTAFLQLDLELSEQVWSLSYLGEGQGSRAIARDLGADPQQIDAVFSKTTLDLAK